MTAIAPKTGGWVEFYRSPARKLWTPTGVNVPEYGKLAQVWWQNVSKAISGEQTPQQAMDGLARDQDAIMARLEKSGVQGKLGPKLNEEQPAEYWYEQGKEGRQSRAATQARQRKAAGNHHRLRRTAQVLEGRKAAKRLRSKQDRSRAIAGPAPNRTPIWARRYTTAFGS